MTVISIVVPSRNEERSIENCLREIEEVLPASKIIVVDRSEDETPRIVKKLAKEYGNIELVEIKSPGKGAGLKEGFRRAEGIIVMIDADCSFPPSEIPRILKLLEKADVVIGSRYCSGGKLERVPLLRRITGRRYSFLFRLFFGINDPQSGLKAFRREVLERVGEIKEDGFEWDSVFIARARRAGLRVVEHPITFTAQEGKTNVNILKTSWQMWLNFICLVLGLK